MDPDPASVIILLLALLWIGMIVAAEIALSSVKQADLDQLNEPRPLQERNQTMPRSQMISKIHDNLSNFLTTTLLLKCIGLLTVGASLADLYPAGISSSNLWVTLLILSFLVTVLQLLIRNITLRWTVPIALHSASVMQIITQITWPLVSFLRWLGRRMADENQAPEDRSLYLTEEGLRLLFKVNAADASIKDQEKQMIARILDMGDTVAREVMIPRIDVVALNVEADLDDALDLILDVGHSRIPVYEGDIDQVIGFLYAKDVLKSFHEESAISSIRGLMRRPYFVPISKKVNALFREMQKRRVHMAMVVDEYGGTAGLVTIEDLLEEIVGDIQDEYDSEDHAYVETVAPNTYVINARWDLASVGEMLDFELPEDHADTLGGFLYGLLGRVPTQGEQAEFDNWRFTILALDERRIDQVRVEQIMSEPTVNVSPTNVAKRERQKSREPSRFLLFGSGSSN